MIFEIHKIRRTIFSLFTVLVKLLIFQFIPLNMVIERSCHCSHAAEICHKSKMLIIAYLFLRHVQTLKNNLKHLEWKLDKITVTK